MIKNFYDSQIDECRPHLIGGLPGLLRVNMAIRELDLTASPMFLVPESTA